MRAITRDAVRAFNNNQPFKRDNTEIRIIKGDKNTKIQMRLHNNVIAEKTPNGLFVCSCGWRSNTTKERLNGLPGVHVVQRDYDWYLNGKYWTGVRVNIREWDEDGPNDVIFTT
tara:strand:- start:19 stop:360 length:342 start_codon:yes stop_codon:yes gene_type:complete